MDKQQVQPFMQTLYRETIRDEVLAALDTTEAALRVIESHNALSAGMEQGEYDEAHKLVASSYERLCVARQIFDAAREEAATNAEP